jgi:DNA-directed RNA polymerase specialized sigma24 family protein
VSDNDQPGLATTRHRVALAELVKEYQQSVGSYLIHLLGEPEVARALTEETFLLAHRAHAEIRPGTYLRPWLYGMATQLAYRHLRRRRVVRLTGCEIERPLIQSVLGELRPSDRAMLLLCDLEQLPSNEVALIVGISTERLYERLARARARFRFVYVAHHTVVGAC